MRKPLIALIVAAVVGTSILVVDIVGVLFGGEDWQYGETEMRAAVEGTWELTITDQGVAKKWTLGIKQSDKADRAERETGLVRSAAACGSRSFVKNAHACGSMSAMPIEIAVLDGPEKLAAGGRFYVGSTRFERGSLEIRLGKDPDDFQNLTASATAGIDPTGKVVKLWAGRSGTDLEATLVRTKR